MSSALNPHIRLLLSCLAFQLLSWAWAPVLFAFSILPPNHQEVTQQGLGSCCFEYTMPNGAKVSFSTEALSTVMFGNVNMDILSLKDEQLAEDFHFDDERFDFGQFVLLYTRDLIVVQLQDEAFAQTDAQSLLRQQMLTRTSREMLGNALHTLQDYYAHTNWVERGLQNGNLAINPMLGVKGKSLHGPSEQACDEGAPGLTQLTSGYYLATGVFDCTNICSAPANECAHGNIACPGLDCGINKDVSPRDHFAEAFDLAKEHTALFVRQIFAEALSGNAELRQRASVGICALMGVPDSVNTCITQYTLTVQKINQAGGGATAEGLVQSTSGNITPAINCGLLCQGTSPGGTEVQLTASNSGDWTFVRWAPGGACSSSTNPVCTVSMTGNMTAIAEFSDTSPPIVLASFSTSCGVSAGQRGGTCTDTTLPESLVKTYEGAIDDTNNGEFIASASVQGSVARLIGSGSSVTAHIATTALGQWGASGHFHATVDYEDSFLVTSPTLPNGTPVTVRVTLPAHFAFNSSGSLTEPEVDPNLGILWPGAYARLGAGSEAVYATFEQPPEFSGSPTGAGKSSDLELVVTTAVGGSLSYRVTLEVQLNSSTTRAMVDVGASGATSGPYFQELSGKNVRFER